MTIAKQRNILKKIREDKNTNALYKRVIDDALKEENPLQYLNEAIGQNGSINGLIYYTETHKFFDDFYDEILEAVDDYENSTGEKLSPKYDIKNWYTWFASEITAFNLASGLE